MLMIAGTPANTDEHVLTKSSRRDAGTMNMNPRCVAPILSLAKVIVAELLWLYTVPSTDAVCLHVHIFLSLSRIDCSSGDAEMTVFAVHSVAFNEYTCFM
jgi:hypothetical protein